MVIQPREEIRLETEILLSKIPVTALAQRFCNFCKDVIFVLDEGPHTVMQ